MARKKMLNGVLVNYTAEEEAQADIDQKNWEDESAERKLEQIKKIRLQKLIDTDYLANSDVTMPDNIKTWRQSLRDIPQDYTTETKYDELLARNEQGKLTNSIWTIPS